MEKILLNETIHAILVITPTRVHQAVHKLFCVFWIDDWIMKIELYMQPSQYFDSSMVRIVIRIHYHPIGANRKHTGFHDWHPLCGGAKTVNP